MVLQSTIRKFPWNNFLSYLILIFIAWPCVMSNSAHAFTLVDWDLGRKIVILESKLTILHKSKLDDKHFFPRGSHTVLLTRREMDEIVKIMFALNFLRRWKYLFRVFCSLCISFTLFLKQTNTSWLEYLGRNISSTVKDKFGLTFVRCEEVISDTVFLWH